MTERRGLFLTFEGPDGSGKSTQMRLLAKKLAAMGYRVVETVEPGGTRIGEQIRRILLEPEYREMCARTELLLYFAARAQNVEERIEPALREGRIVLSDRYTDSTMAYQGFARALGAEVVEQLHRIACGGLQPHLTLCYDIDVETGLARARRRGMNRMDDQALEFHRRVREAYHEIARREPRIRLIDGAQPIEKVFEATWGAVEPLLAGAQR
jgi:dTMP kinase